jgi:co-chaperonin GroES (HSP10)
MLNTETGKHQPTGLNPGDVVLINPFLGMRATLDGEEVIIQQDQEILGREVSA